jgi:hypothetical protein
MSIAHRKRIDLGCLSVATNHLFALSLYTVCMKTINTQVDTIRRKGFQVTCDCRSDFGNTIAPIECLHGGAICLSAGGSPPPF